MKLLLPLTNLLRSINLFSQVRVEYVNLLIRIQSLRVSKLWEVISDLKNIDHKIYSTLHQQVIDMKHLIVRLAVDASKNVCRRLVVLLAPFYNPKSQPEVVLERCLRLVMVFVSQSPCYQLCAVLHANST